MEKQHSQILDYFATPVIWYPHCEISDEDIQQMINRSVATNDWALGKLDTESFLDCLDENNVDVYSIVDDWEEGITFLT